MNKRNLNPSFIYVLVWDDHLELLEGGSRGGSTFPATLFGEFQPFLIPPADLTHHYQQAIYPASSNRPIDTSINPTDGVI